MTHSQMSHQLLKKGRKEGHRIRDVATSKDLESVQDLNYKEQTEKDKRVSHVIRRESLHILWSDS